MSDALSDDELEEEADEEVDKILYELTDGKLGLAGSVGAELPVRTLYCYYTFFALCVADGWFWIWGSWRVGTERSRRGYQYGSGDAEDAEGTPRSFSWLNTYAWIGLDHIESE